MLRMLNFFDLADGVDVGTFEASLREFSQHLVDEGLLHSVGPLAERVAETPMDTDEERAERWFFVSTFVDRDQCDAAYALIASGSEPTASLHDTVRSKMMNGVFSCWQDPEST